MNERLERTWNSGKIPPQNLELEECVLGAALLEKKATQLLCKLMSREQFYKESHQIIFGAIFILFNKGNPVDLPTVAVQLRSTGELDMVGGGYYLSQLAGKISSTANIEAHIKYIQQSFIKRKVIEIGSGSIKKAYEDTSDFQEVLDHNIIQLIKLNSSMDGGHAVHVSQVTKENMDKIVLLRSSDKRIMGIPSGMAGVDFITNGWQDTDSIIIAGRPGMGKTALMLKQVKEIAVERNIPVAIFSLEMGRKQLVLRLLSMISGIYHGNITRGNISDADFITLQEASKQIDAAPIYIDDEAGITTTQLRARALELYQEHGIRIIFFDYVQLANAADGKGMSREQVVSEVARTLKGVAKELDIPVVALAQLSRAVETRGGDKKPILSDLRESGALEQDADIVIFLYRAEYYKLETYRDGSSTKGRAELIIAKHRNGALKDVFCKWNGSTMTFSNDFTEKSYEQIDGLDDEPPF